MEEEKIYNVLEAHGLRAGSDYRFFEQSQEVYWQFNLSPIAWYYTSKNELNTLMNNIEEMVKKIYQLAHFSMKIQASQVKSKFLTNEVIDFFVQRGYSHTTFLNNKELGIEVTMKGKGELSIIFPTPPVRITEIDADILEELTDSICKIKQLTGR